MDLPIQNIGPVPSVFRNGASQFLFSQVAAKRAFMRLAKEVLPVQGSDFWDTRERLRLRAGMSTWPNNVLRHSFGSYFYGKTANENLTAAQMGNSPHIIFKHYRELVKPKAVEAFWKILPLEEEKVVRFRVG